MVVVEMSKASWLVTGIVPGVERQPLKKLEPDGTALLRRNEAVHAGRRSGGWRWPTKLVATVSGWHAGSLLAASRRMSSIRRALLASRERKRAKTDRLDAAMLMRVFLGWLRGERGHCGMVAIPTIERSMRGGRTASARALSTSVHASSTDEECACPSRNQGCKAHLRKAPERLADLRAPEDTGLPTNMIEEFRRDLARLALVRKQSNSIEKTRAERLERAPGTGQHAMV
jgi:transposase